MRIYYLKIFIFITIFVVLNSSLLFAETALQYLYDGNEDQKVGNLDQAIYEYSKAIDMNPNFAKAYDNRGVAYAKEGSLKRAIADFTMAIANNSKDAEAFNNRGRAYAQQGNYYQAIYDYSKSIEINPIYVKAFNNRAQAYYNLQKYDRAWADINEIKKIGAVPDTNLLEELKSHPFN